MIIEIIYHSTTVLDKKKDMASVKDAWSQPSEARDRWRLFMQFWPQTWRFFSQFQFENGIADFSFCRSNAYK